MSNLLNGFAIKHESADMDSNGEYRTMFFAGSVARNKNAWTSETPSNIKRFDTAEQAQKVMRRTGQWWLCSVVTYKEAVEHAAANSEHSDWESSMNDAYCDDY